MFSGSILADFTLGGTEERVNTLVANIWEEVEAEISLTFDGHQVQATGEMWVNGEEYSGGQVCLLIP